MRGPEDDDENDLRINTDLSFEEVLERVMGVEREDEADPEE